MMKIFASWSGEDSKQAAELFRDWLPNVLQEVDIWVSSRDIAKGEKWGSALSSSLASHDFGVIFLTEANFEAPWILFEAGSLSKALGSRVVPILLNIDRTFIAKSPLNQLQNITTSKSDFFELVAQINSHCTNQLPSDRVRRTFDKWWPEFDEALSAISYHREKTTEKEEGGPWSRIESALSDIMGTLKRMPSASGAINNDAPPPQNLFYICNIQQAHEKGLVTELMKRFPGVVFHRVPTSTTEIQLFGEASTAPYVRRARIREIATQLLKEAEDNDVFS